MIYRYIYMIVCTAGSWKNKYYIGQHTTKNLDDGYKGSGTLLKKYYKKYPNDYVKSIICYCDSQKQLDEREKECISLCLGNKDCLNIAIGGKNCVGINCCYRMTQEEYKQYCDNISKSLKGHKGSNPMCNMNDSEILQWKKKLSDKSKGRIISDQQKRTQSSKMSHKYDGYKFMSDGYNVVFISPEYWGEFIDIGYIFSKQKYKL